MEQLYLPIVIYPGNLRTKLLLLIRKCCRAFIKVQTGRLIMVNVASLQMREGVATPDGNHQQVTSPKNKPRRVICFPPMMQNKREHDVRF